MNEEHDLARRRIDGQRHHPSTASTIEQVGREALTEKKTLFVVTSGCYSDYGITAIFDDRELADRYCEGSDDSRGYGYRVEEYELNPSADDIRAGLKTHYIVMDRDGNVRNHSEGYGGTPEAGHVAWAWNFKGRAPWPKIYEFKASIVAKSKEQAIKAANEQRARWIADGKEWPDDEVQNISVGPFQVE